MNTPIILLVIACSFVGELTAKPEDEERQTIISACNRSEICEDNKGYCYNPQKMECCGTSVPNLCPLKDTCECCVKEFAKCHERCRKDGVIGRCFNPYDPDTPADFCQGGTIHQGLCRSATCSCCIPTPDCGNSTICDANDGECYDPRAKRCPYEPVSKICPKDTCNCCVRKFAPCGDKCQWRGTVGRCYNPYDPQTPADFCKDGTRYDDLCCSPTCTCCIPKPCGGYCFDGFGKVIGKCRKANDPGSVNDCAGIVKGICGSPDCECCLRSKDCGYSKICDANNGSCYDPQFEECPHQSVSKLCPKDSCECCVKKFDECGEKCEWQGTEGRCYNPFDPQTPADFCKDGTVHKGLCNSPTCACCIKKPCTGSCFASGFPGIGQCRKLPINLKECDKIVYGSCGSPNCACCLKKLEPAPCDQPCRRNGKNGKCINPQQIKCPGDLYEGLCKSSNCKCCIPRLEPAPCDQPCHRNGKKGKCINPQQEKCAGDFYEGLCSSSNCKCCIPKSHIKG